MARSLEASVPQLPVVLYHDWVKENVPDLSGQVAIVTGSNSGVGFWCAAALAGKGAHVVLACRTTSKAEAAKKEILEMHPTAKLELIHLDNMSLSSVKEFAASFKDKFNRLDLLVNNAGVMATKAQMSEDGHDVQFQTNHLAHFLLTSLLWDKLVTSSPGPARIVQVTSGFHVQGSFSRLQMENPPIASGKLFAVSCILPMLGIPTKPADQWRRYRMTKLCNVLFGLELQRRIDAAKLNDRVLSVICAPGWASTQLQYHAGQSGSWSGWEKANEKSAQSAADGALPLLFACVGAVKGGTYTQPAEAYGTKGLPVMAQPGGESRNDIMAKDLWNYSEECCGLTFAVGHGVA